MYAGRGAIDGNWPIVSGHIPIELVILIEESGSVAHAVSDGDGARGIDGVGNVNFEIAGGAGGGRIVFEFGAVFIGDAFDVDEKLVVRAVWSGIFDGNRSMNAVPLANENQRDGFVHQSAAVIVDGDGVLKVGDAPGFCGGGRGESEDGCEQQCRNWTRPFLLYPDHKTRTSRRRAHEWPRWSRRTGAG